MRLEFQLSGLHKVGHQFIQFKPLLGESRWLIWSLLPLSTLCKIKVVSPTGIIDIAIRIPLWPIYIIHKINLLMLP